MNAHFVPDDTAQDKKDHKYTPVPAADVGFLEGGSVILSRAKF